MDGLDKGCNVFCETCTPIQKLSFQLKCSTPVRFVAKFSIQRAGKIFHFLYDLVLDFMGLQHNFPGFHHAAIKGSRTTQFNNQITFFSSFSFQVGSLVLSSYPFRSSFTWGKSSSSLSFSILFDIVSALRIATRILLYESFTAALVLSTASPSPLAS